MPFPLLSILPAAAGLLGPLLGGKKGAAVSGAGGLLGSILNAAGPVGAGAAGAAAGMAGERGQENLYNISRNNAQTQRYGIQQGALNDLLGMQERGTMDRAGMKIAAPSARAGQVVKGSLMELLQPAKISHPRAVIPEMSGGLTPAALSPAVRQAGRDLQSQAGDALRTGSDIPALPDFKANMITPPEVEDYQKPGGLETTLTTGSTIANILAALAKQAQDKKRITGQPVPPPLPPEMDPVSQAALGIPQLPRANG